MISINESEHFSYAPWKFACIGRPHALQRNEIFSGSWIIGGPTVLHQSPGPQLPEAPHE
jgi:hypothetical protein